LCGFNKPNKTKQKTAHCVSKKKTLQTPYPSVRCSFLVYKWQNGTSASALSSDGLGLQTKERKEKKYPGGEVSSGAPKEEFCRMVFEKKFPGGLYFSSVNNANGVEAWRWKV